MDPDTLLHAIGLSGMTSAAVASGYTHLRSSATRHATKAGVQQEATSIGVKPSTGTV